MKTRRNFTIVLTAVLAIAAIGTPAWAASGGNSNECGLIGTWTGHAGSSMWWLGLHTAGSQNAKNGEMLLNWVYVAGDLLNGASHMTPGHGVWEQIANGTYNYTWYTFGIDSSGSPIFSVRVKGVATNTDCNNVAISYTYDVFASAVLPQNMSGSNPVATITGSAEETRVPLVTP